MKITEYFTKDTRDNGETFHTLREDRPDWLQEAVYDAHQGRLPDDWVYETCLAACEAVEDGSLTEEEDHEFADGQVDIYTRQVFQWAADFCLSGLYSEAEEEAEMDGMGKATIEERIKAIQYFAIRRIAQTMLTAIEANSDE